MWQCGGVDIMMVMVEKKLKMLMTTMMRIEAMRMTMMIMLTMMETMMLMTTVMMRQAGGEEEKTLVVRTDSDKLSHFLPPFQRISVRKRATIFYFIKWKSRFLK